MTAKTDIAIESADVVLMKSDLLDVASAIQFSRAVMNALRLRMFTPRHKFSADTVPPKKFGKEPVPSPVNLTSTGRSSMKKVIAIEGMRCGHCTNAVEKALRTISGIDNISVDLASKQAIVESLSDIDDEQVNKAITGAGYQVVDIR